MPPPYAVPRGGDLPADPAPQVAPSRRELVRSVVAALVNGREVVTVAGQRGIGKTTMLHAIATALNADDFIAVQVDGARCSRDELHRLMGAALGVVPDKPVEATDLLRALLDQRYRMELVILLDDADALTSAMSRYLRVLLDVFNNLEPNLHLVLAGAAETWDGLRQLDAETFEKIAPAPLAIDAFTEEEAEAYLKQSLSLQPARSRRVIMTGWRSRSILRKAQGNPAAIDAALAQWRKPGGVPSVETGAIADRVPVFARASVAAAALTLVAAVVIPVHAPPSGDTISSKARPLPAAHAPLALADSGRVDNFSAAIATAKSDPPPSRAARNLAVHPLRLVPAEQASSAVPQQTAEIPPGQRVPEAPAPATPPLAPTPDPVPSPASIHSPIASPATTAPVVPDAAPPDGVRLALAQPERPPAPVTPTAPEAPKPPEQSASATLLARRNASVRPPSQPATGLGSKNQAVTPPPGSPEPLTPSNTAQNQREVSPAPRTSGGPGLVLIARRGDTLDALYARVYRGVTPPPYEVVVAANPKRIVPGTIVVFPTPVEGWSQQ